MEGKKGHDYNTRNQKKKNYKESSSEENTPPGFFKEEEKVNVTPKKDEESKTKESSESEIELRAYIETPALKKGQKRISRGKRAIIAAATPLKTSPKRQRMQTEPLEMIDLVQSPNFDNAIPSTSGISTNAKESIETDIQIDENSSLMGQVHLDHNYSKAPALAVTEQVQPQVFISETTQPCNLDRLPPSTSGISTSAKESIETDLQIDEQKSSLNRLPHFDHTNSRCNVVTSPETPVSKESLLSKTALLAAALPVNTSPNSRCKQAEPLKIISGNVLTLDETEEPSENIPEIHQSHNSDRPTPSASTMPANVQGCDKSNIQIDEVTSSDNSFEAEFEDDKNIGEQTQEEMIRIKGHVDRNIIDLKAAFERKRLEAEHKTKLDEVELNKSIKLLRNEAKEKIRLLKLKDKKQQEK